MAIFAHNNTSKDSGFTPTQIVMGYAPRVPCFIQVDTDNIPVIELTRHGYAPHDAREALLCIHETRVKRTTSKSGQEQVF